MNRHDVQILQDARSYPSVTITMPTHRTSPDNRQDPIRLRNLITQAADRLRAECSARETESLETRLTELAREFDHAYALDGLALFANREMARSYSLPFALKERVVVDESFATRDLVHALHRAQRYWTLVLSEKPTRLLEGSGDTLVEVSEAGFPMIHEGPGGEAPLPGGTGINTSAYRDDHHRQFFRRVDAGLRTVLTDDALPVVLVGVDRYLAFFREVTGHEDAILTTVAGSHGRTSASALAKLVWPPVEEALAARRREVKSELARAVGAGKVASTIGEAWRFAREGRGALLLVEEGFHYPAVADPSGWLLSPAVDASAPGVLDDAVDEVIEVTLSKQGQVVFLPDGELTDHQRIALILRY